MILPTLSIWNYFFAFYNSYISRPMTKPAKWYVRPAKNQISLGIRQVWSEFSLSAWRNIGHLTTFWAHSEDSEQTANVIILVLSCGGSYKDDGKVIAKTVSNESRFRLENSGSARSPVKGIHFQVWKTMCEHAALWKESSFSFGNAALWKESPFRLENNVWARRSVERIPFQVGKQCISTQPCEMNPLSGQVEKQCVSTQPCALNLVSGWEGNVWARIPVKENPFQVEKQCVRSQPWMNPISGWKSMCEHAALWKKSPFRLESNVWAALWKESHFRLEKLCEHAALGKESPFRLGKQHVCTQPCDRNPLSGWKTKCEHAALCSESHFKLESNVWARSPV